MAEATRRTKSFTLSNGETVVLEEWSWAKLVELHPILGNFSKIPFVVENSVLPADREKLKAASNNDLMKMMIEILRMNVPEDFLKNLETLAAASGGEGTAKIQTPSTR